MGGGEEAGERAGGFPNNVFGCAKERAGRGGRKRGGTKEKEKRRREQKKGESRESNPKSFPLILLITLALVTFSRFLVANASTHPSHR